MIEHPTISYSWFERILLVMIAPLGVISCVSHAVVDSGGIVEISDLEQRGTYLMWSLRIMRLCGATVDHFF